ncbi:hypothetical protein NQ314_014514 [Rhamnusium bicolor]|uniref:Very-long-chain 3-oxoacyl-CoA synthase n=1 Tax=Rhamnusium bicolor TaxID=1586634 RepID=A0AAV8X347_9CUCU|nr:hypothetical protein NQ314_014514 [Rhamnusium bicolor]
MAIKFFGGGSGIFTGLINSLVHTVMYTYYLLTAFDERWKQSVTFKRTITQMQIVSKNLKTVRYTIPTYTIHLKMKTF